MGTFVNYLALKTKLIVSVQMLLSAVNVQNQFSYNAHVESFASANRCRI